MVRDGFPKLVVVANSPDEHHLVVRSSFSNCQYNIDISDIPDEHHLVVRSSSSNWCQIQILGISEILKSTKSREIISSWYQILKAWYSWYTCKECIIEGVHTLFLLSSLFVGHGSPMVYSFTHLLIYSFTHLLIYSFAHLLIYSFAHLLICSFTHLLVRLLCTHSWYSPVVLTIIFWPVIPFSFYYKLQIPV